MEKVLNTLLYTLPEAENNRFMVGSDKFPRSSAGRLWNQHGLRASANSCSVASQGRTCVLGKKNVLRTSATVGGNYGGNSPCTMSVLEGMAAASACDIRGRTVDIRGRMKLNSAGGSDRVPPRPEHIAVTASRTDRLERLSAACSRSRRRRRGEVVAEVRYVFGELDGRFDLRQRRRDWFGRSPDAAVQQGADWRVPGLHGVSHFSAAACLACARIR